MDPDKSDNLNLSSLIYDFYPVYLTVARKKILKNGKN